MRGPIIEKALLLLLAVSAAQARNATNASDTCDIIVRIGYPEGLAPYAVAAPTRWFDGDGACFTFYRHQSGQRALTGACARINAIITMNTSLLQ